MSTADLEKEALAEEAAPQASGGIDVQLSRRSLLRGLGVGAAALGTLGLPTQAAKALSHASPSRGPFYAPSNRIAESFLFRMRCASLAASRPRVLNRSNGEEQDYPGFIANYHKGLPHDGLGHVVPAAYRSLLEAVRTGRNSDFDKIILGLGRKLTSAQAGLAFELEGADSHHTYFPPAPRIDTAEHSGEAVELYWMALCRDVSFADYESSPLVARAAAELTQLSDYRGRKQNGSVAAATIFRGREPGCEVGPWISQFLYQEIPYGAQTIGQRSLTGSPGVDYMSDFPSWLNIQNGADLRGTDQLEPVRRYIRNLRDLAGWVHIDALYQAYLNACLILLGLHAPFKPGIPSVASKSCEGFVDWGPPHLLALVTEVSTRALKAVWYHKWFVHRRMRAEAFGGLVHNQLTGAASYPIDSEVLDSEAVETVFSRNGSYLLPQAFVEGSPTHPSYGSGHATVAGACVTILKAWFDESFEIPSPVRPSSDGTELLPYSGPPLTVAGELNKVAANVALGRNAAGIHWLTDYYHSLRLGEYVAKTILEEQKTSYNQSPTFVFTSFDGKQVKI